jgi:hypothetical protein
MNCNYLQIQKKKKNIFLTTPILTLMGQKNRYHTYSFGNIKR